MGERQYGSTLAKIRADHVQRYQLAAKYAVGRVLDAACGCGYGSSILLKASQLVVGVDAAPAALEWGEQYYGGPQYLQGRIEESPWSGMFNTIVSLETLEHLKDPTLALDNFKRSLDGLLIASVPNEERYPFTPESFANDEFPHQRHYTPKQFTELLEKSGFKIKERFCQKDRGGEIHPGTDGMFLIYVAE